MENCTRDIERAFKSFWSDTASINIGRDEMDRIVKSGKDLLMKGLHVFCELFREYEHIGSDKISKFEEILEKIILKEYSNIATHEKRVNKIKNFKAFVSPVSYAIGTSWEFNYENKCYELKQNVFQYVPILQTLKSLLSDEIFFNMYNKFNGDGDHLCSEGTYHNFCCGETFKHNELFTTQKNAIQILIFFDCVNLCNPLQSKSAKHNTLGVYFQINNIPHEYKSKLNNIYLVALCNANYIKEYSMDYVLVHIVNELKELENIGIYVEHDGKQRNYKGTLITTVCDNLGGNQVIGLTESFGHDYFCRNCTCTKLETETLTTECLAKLRNKPDYISEIEKINNSLQKIKPSLFLGYKRYCLFNNLTHFHILDNPYADIMHDINEGVIPFLLKEIFTLMKAKGFGEAEINKKVKSYRYGVLHKKNAPSKICLDKSNLGQNAFQLYNLMIYFPFIFVNWYEELKDTWCCVTNWLKIMEIIYSRVIKENDLIELEQLIATFFENFKTCFNVTLKPKCHFITHYPSIIRKMGPLINLWTMRMENKHQHFTQPAKRQNNFKNICKSLTYKHQHKLALNGFTYESPAYETPKTSCLSDRQFSDVLKTFFGDLSKVQTISYIKFNNLLYEKTLVVVHFKKILEIVEILVFDKEYFLVCTDCVTEYNQRFNSLTCRRNSTPSIIKLCELTNKRTYQTILINGTCNIIKEDLGLSIT